VRADTGEKSPGNSGSPTADSADHAISQVDKRTSVAAADSEANSMPTPQREEKHASQSSARWWLAVVVGAVISLPFAWLLSYAATLPFFIGLFFFVLFGLVIGAVMHRTAASHRPYAKSLLLAGTSIVVLFGWTLTLIKESRDFPLDMAQYAVSKARDIGEQTVDEYHDAVVTQVQEHLLRRYPPGGTIGYIRWALTSGEIEKGEIESVEVTLGQPQRRYLWAIRVVLSFVLLAFGIGSQTLPLRLVKERAVRAIDEVD